MPRTTVDLSEAGPATLIDGVLLDAFHDGKLPHHVKMNYKLKTDEWKFLPTCDITRTSIEDTRWKRFLVEGDGWKASMMFRPGNLTIEVYAVTTELALAVVEEHNKLYPPPPVEPDKQMMNFWKWSQYGRPDKTTRPITIRPWEAIQSNYNQSARGALDQLIKIDHRNISGKLLLMYGPPGTGKTNALASIATEWKSWCEVDCVMDPERMFNDPNYIISLLNTEALIDEELEEEHDNLKYRLVILEDCDELIREEAKTTGGQALSRLLNVTDGLIGQSSKLLVAITTNEDIAKLHPAVTRPGRCLAQIEVGKFSSSEAESWMGKSLPPKFSEGATLAELYELKGNSTVRSEENIITNVGQYL